MTPPASDTVANNGLSPHNCYNDAVPLRHLVPPWSFEIYFVDFLVHLHDSSVRTSLYLWTGYQSKPLKSLTSPFAAETDPPDRDQLLPKDLVESATSDQRQVET